ETEAQPEPAAAPAAAAEAAPAREALPAEDTGQRRAAVRTETGVEEAGLPDGVRASPLARRLAEELNVDVRQGEGSGPQGRTVRPDVEELAERAPAEAQRPGLAPAYTPAPADVGYMPVEPGRDDTVIETARLRDRIGRRMV